LEGYKLKRPNFFIVGAAKSGTTSLASALAMHPECYMSKVKEPYYFCKNPKVDKKTYMSLFQNATNEKIIGEATTGYLFDPNSSRLIHEYDKNSKILIVLRNPIDMIYSFWGFMNSHGNETRSFESILKFEENGKAAKDDSKLVGRSENYEYLERAKYFSQVKRYIEQFENKNVLVILYEDLISNQQKNLNIIFNFLELSNIPNISLPKLNEARVIKSRLLHNIIHRKYAHILGFLPVTVRTYLRQKIIRLNTRKANRPKLNYDDRVKLWKLLRKDVKKLQAQFPKLNLVETWSPK